MPFRPWTTVAGIAVLTWTAVLPLDCQVLVDQLPATDTELSADFEAVFRVGDGGAPWELLTSVTSLAFDASGRLHITDVNPNGGDMRVLVVDSLGRACYQFRAHG